MSELDSQKDLETKLEIRLHRFFFRALIAFAVIGMTSAGSLLGFNFVLHEIQRQRQETIEQNCIQQNIRHDNAILRAKEVLPKQAQGTVIILVNELQPYVMDCKSFSVRRVRGDK